MSLYRHSVSCVNQTLYTYSNNKIFTIARRHSVVVQDLQVFTTKPSQLEPRKPVGTRHAESIRAGFGTFFFLTDRACIGSDRSRAHLASCLLLCPNMCTPHMYCMKYCYNNYIINIIHRLCNRQVHNAYTHALAYR